jgi:hypothetical protein
MAKRVQARSSDFVISMSCGEDADMHGRVEHVQSGQVQRFRSFLELLGLMHNKLEETGFPQNTTEIRSWKEESPSGHSGR